MPSIALQPYDENRRAVDIATCGHIATCGNVDQPAGAPAFPSAAQLLGETGPDPDKRIGAARQ
jgi:hypothetical protein